MTENSPKYIVDTCSFTTLRRVYPREMFSPVWTLLSDLAREGAMASVDQVLEELKAQDDVVTQWAESHVSIFLALDAPIQEKAGEILARFPDDVFLDLRKRKSGADPFVVAAAMVNHAAVVTEEKKSGGPNKVKIPDVCASFGVDCFPLLELLRREGLCL